MTIKPAHLFRFGLGIDMLMHGLVRIPHLDQFVGKTAGSMTSTFLPDALVRPFLTVLPFIEAIIGILILIGGKIGRWGIIGGGFLMGILLFGAAARQDWPLTSQQVTYLTAFAIALYFHDKETPGLS